MTKDIDPDFDPAKHTLTESSYFEDLEIGQRFLSPSRTLGDANFAAFQMVSGDNHPIHYDEEYCRDIIMEFVQMEEQRVLQVSTVEQRVSIK